MIIDHVDGLELPHSEVRSHFNELRSLAYLAKGLEFLCDQVQHLEAEILKSVGEKEHIIVYGNAPQLSSVPQDLVACAFHWYAVTVCNYVRMVGWLVYGGNSTKAANYSKRVIPEVHLWRDKVGAHFARISPAKDDTPADLAASVMFPIAFDYDAFYTGSFKLIQRTGGKSSSSRGDMRWSLTHTHRTLVPRYWPKGV